MWLFNGNVGRPMLSSKVTNIWQTVNSAGENRIQVAIDNFNDLIYVILPTGVSTTPNLVLVADYSAGLDPENIRWSKYSFPWQVIAISMINFNDFGDFGYWLRMSGASNSIYKLSPAYTVDYSNVAISAYYQTALLAFAEGAINIFNYLRMRIRGAGTISITMTDEDGVNPNNIVTPPTLTLSNTPSQDLATQINYMNEKMSIKLAQSSLNSNMTVTRLDVYGRVRFGARPNA
jgi:hypothetical protein